MEKDINFTFENRRFNFRVACFVTRGKMVLLEKHNKCDFYNLPGGRVKMGESTLEALKREVLEELGIEVINPKLFYIAEEFYNYKDTDVQEMLFIYHIELGKTSTLLQTKTFSNKDEPEEIFYWTKFRDIKKVKCLPEIIYKLPKMKTNKLFHLIKKD